MDAFPSYLQLSHGRIQFLLHQLPQYIRDLLQSLNWCLGVSRNGGHPDFLKDSNERGVEKCFVNQRLKISRDVETDELTSLLPISKASEPVPWSSCLADVQYGILSILGCKELSQFKTPERFIGDVVDSDGLHLSKADIPSREVVLTALHFIIDDGVLNCRGYDTITSTWCTLPPFTMLPPLNEDLFQAYSICGAGGLLCANVGKEQAKLMTFNPSTRSSKELPCLNHPRSLVLMHVIVNQEDNAYKVIVAGSSRLGEGHLSRITEVFDSRTWSWKVTGELPGPQFALNDYQTGVYADGILYCVAFLGDGEEKGILAYNVEEEKWSVDRKCSLPNCKNSNTLQLVENNGQVYLFSELEFHDDEQNDPRIVHRVEHRIDVLLQDEMNLHSRKTWRNVITERNVGDKGLQTYPEYTCIPFGEGKLCIFNSLQHNGIVYDLENEKRCDSTLRPPTWFGSDDEGFYTLNPLTFNFKPNFKSMP